MQGLQLSPFLSYEGKTNRKRGERGGKITPPPLRTQIRVKAHVFLYHPYTI